MNRVNSIYEIPGFLEAVEKEQLIRDASFLPVVENVNGFEVLPMRLWHYIALRACRSPMLPPFRTPSPEQLAGFLWLLNPEYSTDAGDRKRFMKRCRRFAAQTPPWFFQYGYKERTAKALACMADTLIAARNYVNETMQDKPGRVVGSVGGVEQYSDGASICGRLAREYGWSEYETLEMPLKRIFQYLKEIRDYEYASRGQTAPLGSPSEEIVADYLKKINQKN